MEKNKTALDDLVAEEMATNLNNNPYYFSKDSGKPTYDSFDILVSGAIPSFTDDSQRFICAMETSSFVNDVGVMGLDEANIRSLFSELDVAHIAVFINNLNKERQKLGIFDINNYLK